MSTPLATLIRDLIRLDGPMGLDRYMALAGSHPVLGYYATRDPFGAAGDFVTAPEISQMFGEMLGLWTAVTWAALGSPDPVRLVELGPGRGTLMADALRAARAVPGFLDAVDLHLVETSPLLRARQAEVLASAPRRPTWHASLEGVPEGPLMLLANEFFDALPVRHYQRTERGWHERLIGLGEGDRLVFGLAPEPEPRIGLDAPAGAILEVAAAGPVLMHAVATRIARDGGAALVIDYGHVRSGLGETLQALRRHAPEDPLGEPGEADLTAHVDFAALARAAAAGGAQAHGPISQASFLRTLGIEARAARLAASRPEAAATLSAALGRLTAEAAPTDMGRLFKVLAITAREAPTPAGFPPAG